MNRRAFLKAIGSAALLPILPRRLLASTNFSRRRPSDAAWPSQSAWKQLNEAVGGNLIPVDFPLSVFKTDPNGAAAKLLAENKARAVLVEAAKLPKVSIEGSRVAITAESKSEKEAKDGDRVLHSERFASSYARTFELPAAFARRRR